MLTALLLRHDLDVNVLHDRNPLFVKLSDGGVRNGYTVKILNKLYGPRAFSLSVDGLPGAKLSVVGLENETNPIVTVPPDELKSIRLYVTLDKAGGGGDLAAWRRASTSWSPTSPNSAAHGARRDLPGAIAMNGTAWFANEIRGRHVLIGFIVFFGLIFLVNGVFLYYALTTFGGGETSNPYRKGLHYNETLAEAARAGRARLEGRARLRCEVRQACASACVTRAESLWPACILTPMSAAPRPTGRTAPPRSVRSKAASMSPS